METSLKTGFAQIFSSCPKNLSCPKFGGAAAPLAPLARTPMVARWCIQAGACRGQFNKTVTSLIYKCGYSFRVWKQKLHLKRFMKFIPGGCVARVQMPGRRHDQRNNKAFLQGPDSGTLLCEELRPFPHEHTLYPVSCGRGLERHWRAVSKTMRF